MGQVTALAPSPLLLDTHALLWMLTEPAKLPKKVHAVVADPHRTLLVSTASAWEIATKYRLGTLAQAQALVQGYEHHLHQLNAQQLPVISAHALLAGTLEWDHRDPFDRMIAAQCLVESVALVSSDPAFATVPGLRLVW